MSSVPQNSKMPYLPTLDRLGGKVDPNVPAFTIAKDWFQHFSDAVSANDVVAIMTLFLADSYWKDILAFTWDLRTLHGRPDIQAVLASRLPETELSQLQFAEDQYRAPKLDKPYPDLVLLQFCFDFETKVGRGMGVCRLVPTTGDGWKAYTMYTCLESLKGFPAKTEALRNPTLSFRGSWEEHRRREREFEGRAPSAIIIGGGHVGLEVAARLKNLDVPALVVEQNKRIGDNWRNRYESLCLNDPVWFNTMPIMPFPTSWPVFAPAAKVADWLESYANALDLDVWTSSKVQSATWNDNTKTWRVEIISTGNQDKARLFEVKHLVFATGFAGNVPKIPEIPKKDIFKGQCFHSSQYKYSDKLFDGKKVIVVGGCTSALDIAQELCSRGVDAVVYQRSPTYVITTKALRALLDGLYNDVIPTGLADHFSSSVPWPTAKLLHQRTASHLIKTIDKDTINNLEKVGFRTHLGIDGSGRTELFLRNAGGYYIDTGTSQKIINGQIKIKSGGSISEFTERGLMFVDGSELQADVVVFATGWDETPKVVRSICGPEVSSRLGPIWGLDEEGELRNVWKKCGIQGLWIGMGNFAISRFYSCHLALQIKAIEEGLLKA